ncbi:GTP-binding protein [Dysgonomonas macrotermitis]|uniref:Large ribosomal subunit assembly factor BipA n=2 Tax=Dysgonomonas macrotermitis TaxID=1346286 RepID=A0A1M4TXG3_9BACT|nr:GTP-binding protein [Dysgonomonas macrotermitis]
MILIDADRKDFQLFIVSLHPQNLGMQNIRNIAIIAHVDHGKTTTVDKLLLAGQLFRENQEAGELILDNNDLERERGITILSKNVSINYKGTKINIIDTPGHADFGGEVERVLNMADGCLLLVDAFEGPMPQTRFVLQKAIEIGLKPIVVINKVDKPNCRPEEVHEMVFDLMFSLDATEEQLDFPTIYGSAKNGWMSTDWKTPATDFTALLDAIVEYIPAPEILEGTPQMLITSLDFSKYVGRIAVGRVHRGELREGMDVSLCKRDGSIAKSKIKELHVFEGLGRAKVQSVQCGDICALIGIDGFEIGDTIADSLNPEPLDPIDIDEPTMSMLFTINNSPFFGKEGKFVTSRHIYDRLVKELDKNLALRVETTESADSWIVYGRGILHLSVLIETMRREGYELQVGQPKVIIKEIDGVKCEPIEQLSINLPDEYASKIIDLVTRRKGELVMMESKNERTFLEFNIPSRGIIGINNAALTLSAGEAIISHRFIEFQPWKGDIDKRQNGSIIASESGNAFAYAIDKLQDRGRFFVEPQTDIYMGQIVGEHSKEGDLVVNLTKSKKLTNVRASGTDDKASLAPAVIFSLEEALEYIKEDEYVEVTPGAIRLRKIYLDENDRKRFAKK